VKLNEIVSRRCSNHKGNTHKAPSLWFQRNACPSIVTPFVFFVVARLVTVTKKRLLRPKDFWIRGRSCARRTNEENRSLSRCHRNKIEVYTCHVNLYLGWTSLRSGYLSTVQEQFLSEHRCTKEGSTYSPPCLVPEFGDVEGSGLIQWVSIK
jgi:hypothetical protein